ncbi:MAG: hypothetical protein MJZ38_07915 [archaeon]|nr:hypothetical protein [archaeon]
MSTCSSRVSRLSMAECLRYLDGEFYHVERRGGRTLVHVNGYYYASDDEGGGGFHLIMFSGAYLDPAELRPRGCWDESGFSAGIIELSDEELVGRISRDVLGVTCLDIGAVTDSTPEGWYHSPRHR